MYSDNNNIKKLNIMNFQVIIKDEKETVFTSNNGKYTKSNLSSDLYSTNLFEYKKVENMIKAIKKVINEDSVIRAWNADGSPNKDFKI